MEALSQLPLELVCIIFEYNPEHRAHMKLLMAELDYEMNVVLCDNENCEKEFHMTNAYEYKLIQRLMKTI